MARKHNYLNNKDILKEIHKSKITYCIYRDKLVDTDFDIILDSVDEITQNTLVDGLSEVHPFAVSSVKQITKPTKSDLRADPDAEDTITYDCMVPNIIIAKENKAKRIAKNQYDDAVAAGEKCKQAEFAIDPYAYLDEDVVFRINTFEHVPLAPPKATKVKPKRKKIVETNLITEVEEDETDAVPAKKKYTRVNFPPFYHYRYVDDKLTQVAKSHWKGKYADGAFDGVFSISHGYMTQKLAMMFMKLCERYATKSNWRGYCVDSSTEALTRRGWLSESEITTDDKILSYDGKNMVWSDIHSIFRDEYQGNMFKMDSRGIDALMTPGHKIVTDKGLVKIEHLLESDKIKIIGDKIETHCTKTMSDSMVELIGWIVTEGNFQPNKKIVTIYQNEGKYADRIRSCLSNLDFEYSEKKSIKSENISFSIKRKHWNDIIALIPNKNLTMDLILSLTSDQQHMLIETMIDADGHRNGLLKRYTQKDKTHMDLFQALCALNGQKMNIHFVENKMSFGKPVSYYTANIFSQRGNQTNGSCINLHGGKNKGKKHPGQGKQFHPNFPTVQYKGTVWCPETDYGSFFARRNGKAYLTGNTYNDEMRGQALLQLSVIGLQFNEAKSQNPFAYYTAVVNNAFRRVLNIEKRNQSIRDDILEANDFTPSYSRQNEHDMARIENQESSNHGEVVAVDVSEYEDNTTS